MYETIQFHLRGVVPLLLHNGQLADPLNPYAKRLQVLSKKRGKTDADHLALRKQEWYGSLYLDEAGEPCIGGENIESMLVAAAKTKKLGPQFKAGVLCDGTWPLLYDGPRNPDELWAAGTFSDSRMAAVQRNKIVRTRPIFRRWELKCDVQFAKGVVDAAQVREAMEVAGQIKGLGDYRPKFGRFVLAA